MLLDSARELKSQMLHELTKEVTTPSAVRAMGIRAQVSAPNKDAMRAFAVGIKLLCCSQAEIRAGLHAALAKLGERKKVLAVPPDFTRFHSKAGELTEMAWEFYGDALTDVLPALGTHTAMTDAQTTHHSTTRRIADFIAVDSYCAVTMKRVPRTPTGTSGTPARCARWNPPFLKVWISSRSPRVPSGKMTIDAPERTCAAASSSAAKASLRLRRSTNT